jgi:A/G-specific adenine glycosylase
LPDSETELRRLPGVGEYTAAAVQAFAFNSPAILVETNIRTVMILELCKGESIVSDSHIKDLVSETLDKRDPRNWYYALMDYGANLKHLHPGVNLRVKNYSKQAPFRGSVREIRGAILRFLLEQSTITRRTLLQNLTKKYGALGDRFDLAVAGLKADVTIVESEKGVFRIV